MLRGLYDWCIAAASKPYATWLLGAISFLESSIFPVPPDVMLTALQPIVDENGAKISMTVLSRRTVDVDEFMEKLEATGAFENVLQRQDEDIEGGMIRAIIDTDYVPEGAEPPEAAPDQKPDPKTAKPSGAATKTAGALSAQREGGRQ